MPPLWRRPPTSASAPPQADRTGSRSRLVGVPLDFRVAGLGDDALDYLAAWELQREVHAAVVAGEPPTPCCCSSTRRCSPPASAPTRTSARPTAAAPRSSTSTAAARSPSTAPASWSATRSSRLPDHVKVVDYVRRIEEALIARLRRLRRHHRPRPRPQRRLAARRRPRSRAQDRRDRHPGQPRRRPCTASPSTATSTSGWYDRFVPCGIADAGVTSLSRGARPRRHRRTTCCPSVEKHLGDLLAWEPLRPPPRTTSRARSRRASPW